MAVELLVLGSLVAVLALMLGWRPHWPGRRREGRAGDRRVQPRFSPSVILALTGIILMANSDIADIGGVDLLFWMLVLGIVLAFAAGFSQIFEYVAGVAGALLALWGTYLLDQDRWTKLVLDVVLFALAIGVYSLGRRAGLRRDTWT